MPAAAATARAITGSGTAKGITFTVATITPASTTAYGGTVARVIDSSTALTASMRAREPDEDPARRCEDVDPPGGRAVDPEILRRRTGERQRHPPRRFVLVTIGGIEPHRPHRLHAGRFERPRIGDPHQVPLLQHRHRSGAMAVREDRSDGVGHRDLVEPHEAIFRSDSVICARTDTAISAGERAPIFRPMGP